MTLRTPAGRVVRDADGARLEFERTVPAAADRVWAAVTDNALLEQWFGRWSGDPASGAVDVLMTAEEQAETSRVAVEACEPPRLLALAFEGPEGQWPLELRLADEAGATRLRFVQRLDEPYDASSIGPGWHYYLDRLEAVVTGTPVPADFDDYFPATSAAYAVPPLTS